jgi:hypothetical protein
MTGLYYPIMFLLCHFFGDYFAQSDWMALNKNKKSWNCLVHVLIYTTCFLLLTTSWKALLFIGVTHFIFDRFPVLIKRTIWLKNHFPTGKYPMFEYCDTTGYYDDSPYRTCERPDYPKMINEEKLWGKPRHFFITIWLYIIHDNTLHLICNLIALTLLV